MIKKYLTEKSFIYLVGDRDLSALDLKGSDDDSNNDGENGKNLIFGTVIRTGDIIKLGRVSLHVKEWSLDNRRF